MRLYIDLDDTVKETSRYLDKVIKSNKLPLGEKNKLYSIISEDFFVREVLCNWGVIPFCSGAINSLKLLETEYEIVFCSKYMFEDEARQKKEFANFMGKELYLFPTSSDLDKSSMDMSGGILIDDNLDVLLNSNADSLYEMYNDFKGIDILKPRPENCSVVTWYSLVDTLLGGSEENENTRRVVYQGVQRQYQGAR